ncbi:hypothetical protein CF319_g6015 [Tilletia indica]|nr:hypothetical protein CF319_g6015 [Tilletia indica]
MAGLDFFGSGSTSSARPHSRPPPSAASAAAANLSRRGLASASASASRSTSGSPAFPASPLRAHTPSSTANNASSSSSPRSGANGALKAPLARPGGLNGKITSPSPSASPGPSSLPSHRPAVVVVRTITTKAKPANTDSRGTGGPSGGKFKYNALPEERRLRIAQEREQREREQAEKYEAEREKAAATAKTADAAHQSVRPLKKRRTTSSASEGKQKSPSQGSNSERSKKRNQRSRTIFSDDDDDDNKDDDAFLQDLSSSRSGKDFSREEWVVPPRQPRDVVREDEEAAVKQVQTDGKDNGSDLSASNSTVNSNSAGIASSTRSVTATSSVDVVNEAGITNFAPYFRDIDDITTITLEYPAMHASETFPLLVPKPIDEYDPISDLLRTIHVMVSSYFPDVQVRTRLFGKLEDLEPTTGSRLLPRDAASPTAVTSILSGQVTPLGSVGALNAGSLSPLTTSASGASTPMRMVTPSVSSSSHVEGGSVALSAVLSTSSERLTTPQPTAIDTPTPISTPSGASAGPLKSASTTSDGESILRSFQRARNRRNGPLFLRTMARFNETMRKARRDGLVLAGIRKMSEAGIPDRLWETIHDQCYSRVVGPKVESLNDYQAFSDNVYGELLPRFSSEIAQLTGLGPSSVFVDMGSGVGNVIVQLALQTGCSAYGCEMMETPATLAAAQLDEARARWAMWGLKGGEVEAWKDNFCTNDRVREVLLKADVVLVNNYAFTPSTNDKLVLQFLDLKDGCHIISLKPFVPHDFRLTERTLSSPLAILRVAERTYTSGCVSWASGGGRYYVHTVDRKIVQDFRPSKTTRGETRKRRWKKNPEEDDDDMMSM